MPVVSAESVPRPEAPGPISPQVPSDYYQNIPSDTSSFGGLQAQSMSLLGRGAQEAGGAGFDIAIARQQLHNDVTSDNQINNYNDQLTQKETAFYALHGQDAVNAYPAFRDDLINSRNEMRSQLQNPMQQLEFDRQTRRMQSITLGRAGIHYDTQYDAFQAATNKAGATLADQSMASHFDDPAAFDAAVADRMRADYRDLQSKGLAGDPTAVAAMQGRVRSDAVKTQIEGYIGRNNTQAAARILNAESGPDGALSAADAARYRTVLSDANVSSAVDRALRVPGAGGGGGAFTAPSGPRPWNLPVAGATPQEQQMLNEIRYREAPGGYASDGPFAKGEAHTGGYQFADSTWKEAAAATGQGGQYTHAKDAPREIQDANALWLYRQRGTVPWASSGPYPQTAGGAGLNVAFKGSLDQMVTDAAAAGVTLNLGSGFRSHAEQADLYAKDKAAHGGTPSGMVAAPGSSEHEKGLAMDLRDAQNHKIAAGSPEDQWLQANQDKYQVIRPVRGEPWHVQPASTARGTQVAAAAPTTTTDVPPGAPAPAGAAPAATPVPITPATAGQAQLSTGKPDYASAIARINADPSLNPDDRKRALGVLGERMRVEHEAATYPDQDAERKLKQWQVGNEADLYAKAIQGQPLDQASLAWMVRTQEITPEAYKAVMAEQGRTDRGTDDIPTVMELTRRAHAGEDVTNDVYAARQADKLKASTATELLKTTGARQRTVADEVERRDFATLRTLAGMDAQDHPMIKLGDDAEKAQVALWGQAQQEWNRRVVVGRENPEAVLADMGPRYSKPVIDVRALPNPRMGDRPEKAADVPALAAATEDAHNRGALSDAQYQEEKDLLIKYNKLLGDRERRTPATTAAPSTGRVRTP